MNKFTKGEWYISDEGCDAVGSSSSTAWICCMDRFNNDFKANAQEAYRQASEYQSRCEQLERENEVLKDRLKEGQIRESNLSDRIAELYQIKFKRFNEEEYWIFQDDGEDYPESLFCPVTMSASKLRELLACRDQLEALKAERDELSRLCDCILEEADDYIEFFEASGGRNHLLMAKSLKDWCEELEQLRTNAGGDL